jgi:hypothetical protein
MKAEEKVEKALDIVANVLTETVGTGTPQVPTIY